MTKEIKSFKKPSSSFSKAVDVLKRYMDKFNYGLYDGSVYKKAPDAAFTYVHCSDVSDFLHYILGNEEIAESLTLHIPTLVHLLSVKSCRLIQPLVLDYNYIEVQPKFTCFNIRRKEFVQNPSDLKGAHFFLPIHYLIFQ